MNTSGQPITNGVNRRVTPADVPREQPVAARHVQPTGREITYGTEELLVTKTDLTGHITYANDVFLRVAGYSEAEMVGQPHSFIRHPDMPRAVFKLLWESIQSGKEIFAYVVNLTRSGDHYWVFAHVTPTFDANGTTVGYHSSRRCPDRAQIEKAQQLYAQMLAAERGHTKKADAIAASSAILERAVKEHHSTYEEFVFSL